MESILRVDGKTADLSTARLQRPRYGASLRAIPVEGQGLQGCGSQLDGIPLQDEGSLGCISETEDRRRRSFDAIRVQDTFLKCLERCCAGVLSSFIARYRDIDDAARSDIVR